MTISAIVNAWAADVGCPNDKLLLLAMADVVNCDMEVNVAFDYLAKKCSMDRVEVQDSLERLESGGFITFRNAKGMLRIRLLSELGAA